MSANDPQPRWPADANSNRLSDGAGGYSYAPNTNREVTSPQGAVVVDGAGYTTSDRGGAPVAQVTGGVLAYLHTDQLGTPRLATNAAKTTVVWNGTARHSVVSACKVPSPLRHPKQCRHSGNQ